jgi:hypothetical protein
VGQDEFAPDSPLEEGGFEPSVPPVNQLVSPAGTRKRIRRPGGAAGCDELTASLTTSISTTSTSALVHAYAEVQRSGPDEL